MFKTRKGLFLYILHRYEEYVMKNIKDLLNKLGFKKYSDEGVDPEQLKMGIEVEKEHTTNPEVARLIALAHLAEDELYYTHLKKMEDKYVKGND